MAGALTISTLNNDTGSLATQNGMTGIPKAWVRFNGTTGAITGSFNVSSITVNTTGYYTINLTTAMPNANYSAIASASPTAGGNGNICATVFADNNSATIAPTTTAYAVNTGAFAYGNYSPSIVCTAVFSS